jgi:hypothetical protein
MQQFGGGGAGAGLPWIEHELHPGATEGGALQGLDEGPVVERPDNHVDRVARTGQCENVAQRRLDGALREISCVDRANPAALGRRRDGQPIVLCGPIRDLHLARDDVAGEMPANFERHIGIGRTAGREGTRRDDARPAAHTVIGHQHRALIGLEISTAQR